MARPVKHKTAATMQKVIDQYFESIKLKALLVAGDMPLSEEEMQLASTQEYARPSVTGLALALDLTRQGLLEYEAKGEEFSDTIKKGKSRVEMFVEDRLYDGQSVGSIFNLKNNFGWQDKTTTEHEGGMELTVIKKSVKA